MLKDVFEVKEEEPVAAASVSESVQPTEVIQSMPVQVDESQPVAEPPPVENEDDDDLSDDSDL